MKTRNTDDGRPDKKLMLIVAAALLLAIGTAGYFAKQYFDLQATYNTNAPQEDAKTIAAKVGKLIKLPSDDTPVVGQIKDKTKLKDQAFFNDAQDGDQLLIYQKSRKAYIYREKDNMLINVDSVNIPDTNKAADGAKK